MKKERIVHYTKEEIDRMIAEGKSQTDWEKVDAMTDEEVHVAALADPNAQPLTDEELKRLRLVPNPKSIRKKLGLSQREFSERYGLSKRTVEAWETERFVPDQAAKTLLRIIATVPEIVEKVVRDDARK